jgi:hypothetical protein
MKRRNGRRNLAVNKKTQARADVIAKPLSYSTTQALSSHMAGSCWV